MYNIKQTHQQCDIVPLVQYQNKQININTGVTAYKSLTILRLFFSDFNIFNHWKHGRFYNSVFY
jgi:hypothetical protein